MNILFGMVDKVPELPYFILAFLYIVQETDGLRAVHAFSVSFIFMALSIIVGAVLKVTFKTKRPVNRLNAPVFRYGFPSIHAMVSIGAIAFLVFIEPFYALLLTPVGLFYSYSRLKLKVHTGADITGGAVLGTIIGVLSGIFILPVRLHYSIEFFFASLMFIVPVCFTIVRIKILKA